MMWVQYESTESTLQKQLKYVYALMEVCPLVIQTEGHLSNLGFNLVAGIELELVGAEFVYLKYLKSELVSLLVLNSFKCLFPFGQG